MGFEHGAVKSMNFNRGQLKNNKSFKAWDEQIKIKRSLDNVTNREFTKEAQEELRIKLEADKKSKRRRTAITALICFGIPVALIAIAVLLW